MTGEMIDWAICIFFIYKSAGLDGIVSAMLWNSKGDIIPRFVGIVDACLRLDICSVNRGRRR